MSQPSSPGPQRVRDFRPYAVVGRLDELHGPAAGDLVLPHDIYWGPSFVYSLDDDASTSAAYIAILNEGDLEDVRSLLNRDRLIAVWNRMTLPWRVYELWETRFPELRSEWYGHAVAG